MYFIKSFFIIFLISKRMKFHNGIYTGMYYINTAIPLVFFKHCVTINRQEISKSEKNFNI